MKKTVRTVEYLSLLFLVWMHIFLNYDAFWLAFVAGSAAIACLGVAVGSLAYDVFHGSRKGGGE